MKKWAFSFLALIAAFTLWSRTKESRSTSQNTPPIPRTISENLAEESPSLFDHSQTEESLREVASSPSSHIDAVITANTPHDGIFTTLPEEDKAWVLQTASVSLKAGTVSEQEVFEHIEALSSVRRFSVLEREEPYYVPNEDVDEGVIYEE